MKKGLLILSFMILTSSAFAKSSVDGIFGMSFADEVDLDGAADLNSDPALILGARYSSDIKNGWGFQTGVTLDSIRDVGSGGKLGFLALFGNATYDFNRSLKNMYVFFGLNLPLFIYEDKNLGDVDPVLGVQFGSGYFLTPKLSLELLYRTMNFEIQSKDANLWGFALQVAYQF